MYANGETITRLRGTPVLDPYSQTVTDLSWDDPDTLEIPGCVIYPTATGETVSVGRDQAQERLTVLVPPGSDIASDDRLIIRGNTFDVDGMPFTYHHPMTGWEPGMEATVTRKVG